jgi:hypothetical protein
VSFLTDVSITCYWYGAKLESLISVLYPDDPDSWLTLMNQPGEIQAFIENGKTTKRASYLTEEVFLIPLSRLAELTVFAKC